MIYLTRQTLRRQNAAERLPPADAVQPTPDIAAVWRDPATRPPGAAAAHDHAADSLTRKETP